jgi:uncharacterized protein (TIGR02300 family)
VVNPDWGIKRTCHSCGAKYYDFKKKAPECPSCNTLFDPEALLKSRRRAMPEEKVKKIETVEEVEVETDDAVEETESDAVLENTDDLGGDDVEVEAGKEEEEEK